MTAPLPNPTPPADPTPVVPGPAPTSVPPAPAPAFDPNSLTPEIKAYLASETARIKAEESARERTASKANAAAEARTELLKQLGLKPDVKPEDAAAELTAERDRSRQLQVGYSVERAAAKAGADDELVSAYLAKKGLLKDLDPTAGDFGSKVDALVAQAVIDKPSLKTAAPAGAPTLVTPPPGGAGPGGAVVPGSQPAPAKRSVNLVEAYAKHYAPKTQ